MLVCRSVCRSVYSRRIDMMGSPPPGGTPLPRLEPQPCALLVPSPKSQPWLLTARARAPGHPRHASETEGPAHSVAWIDALSCSTTSCAVFATEWATASHALARGTLEQRPRRPWPGQPVRAPFASPTAARRFTRDDQALAGLSWGPTWGLVFSLVTSWVLFLLPVLRRQRRRRWRRGRGNRRDEPGSAFSCVVRCCAVLEFVICPISLTR
ncbi:hypothetical protein BD289DRAFT_191198 [Coniella lustricola]|uniref:Uncharacterized protein n=1 Tax=Coniella lustricola TaxID=2025994 RepID=A0A2T2ZSS9_9PEZI|nr:hypothetical protein BD289DRAFT_191198 [Coniella lustricola]